jgi:two-component system LytT family response regulator
MQKEQKSNWSFLFNQEKNYFMIRAAIIDDEKDSIDTLKWKLENYCPEVTVAASFEKPAEGVSYLKKNQIDRLFLDIEMPMLTGFDVLEELGRDI